MRSPTWLKPLKNEELRRLAILTGAACSGTKGAMCSSIEEAMMRSSSGLMSSPLRNRPLSLVSIDMGIRNLAYAHITATSAKMPTGHLESLHLKDVKLRSWRRLSVASISESSAATELAEESSNVKSPSESFEPVVYAAHAYKLINNIISQHNPTHILIERQRFRSGGGAAVQEWTIRVGVFEGMLYAVLKTLAETSNRRMEISGVLPTRVNRYWFEEGLDGRHQGNGKLSGKAVKRAKIDMVGRLLESTTPQIIVDSASRTTVDEFLSLWRKESNGPRTTSKSRSGLLKLDDVADCLLQGLAWVNWQNNIAKLNQEGRDGLLDKS